MAKIQKVRTANGMRIAGSKAAAINSSSGRYRDPSNIKRLVGRPGAPFTVEFAEVVEPVLPTPALYAALRDLGVKV